MTVTIQGSILPPKIIDDPTEVSTVAVVK